MKRDKYIRLAVYQKAEEVFELAQAIANCLEEDELRDHLATEIFTHAALIQAKIAAAEGAGLYSLRMQNAVVIKLAAHDLMNAVSFAEMVNINQKDYVQLMRDKIEEFRVEFVSWVRGFDKSYDMPDNWGIRFDTSTPETEALEHMLFDEDQLNEDEDDDTDEDYTDQQD